MRFWHAACIPMGALRRSCRTNQPQQGFAPRPAQQRSGGAHLPLIRMRDMAMPTVIVT